MPVCCSGRIDVGAAARHPRSARRVHRRRGADRRPWPASRSTCRRNRTVAVVGESGSGKTVISQAMLGILPANARIAGGSIFFNDPRTAGAGPGSGRTVPGRRRPAGNSRRAHLDHLSGADELAVAAAHDRQPDRRGAGAAPQGRSGRGRGPGPWRCCAGSASPIRSSAIRLLSLRAVGRPAPAGDDRHGADLPAGDADRRRADDGARRHHPGADPQADEGPAGRVRHGDPVHQPRPRRGRQHRRRDRGASIAAR